ncbi:FAD dependent oxidoreductase [Terfezia boudieri ATCC MYA-4762]|uniref:L-2-hydroxyglutarate dehydrogenase, mitochondrial n=1 Tax=Terfezia boudieri ATCC MYA-4762 TaxID=1051890 RepID=A0A3N4M815_9PEZI|nr:FAD dependent oxidoreductase [Terfezia boudieri ATCC MYA-4762]
MVGSETSSRNSEVIHAGIYYPKDSLKTQLCIEGARKLYEVLPRAGVGCKKVGKWIIAQTPAQLERLHDIHNHATSLGVPTRFLSHKEASAREPWIRVEAGVLESPDTGIMDSHGYMSYLESVISNNGGTIALNSPVTSISQIDPGESRGWEVEIAGESKITSDTIINAAGLGAVDVHNMIISKHHPEQMLKAYYAKGTYYTAANTSSGKISTLIYPVVDPGLGGLGTHLTLDLTGRVRFGPDVEWTPNPGDIDARAGSNLARAEEAVREYFPSLKKGSLVPDYAGMRPKLGPKGEGWFDFMIRDRAEIGYEGWVDLLGIESPGLTSSLGIARVVEKILYGEREGEEGRVEGV